MNMTEQLVERFLRYVSIPSQSAAGCAHVPSTPGQTQLAKLLEQELLQLNLQDVHLDEHSIVTAKLAGNDPSAPNIGFVAHLDTVDVALSDKINPQRVTFTGQDILLNKEKAIWFCVDEHPELMKYLNQELIVTDGTSVLGADNKAAIAVIMTMLDQLQQQNRPHGDIYVAFVPDEEVGLNGAKKLDLTRFKPDFAYTIDCCELGEVVYETFNAGSATIEIQGVSAHPMSAKNVLVNPIRVANDIINCFDSFQTPEHTEGKEGYYWFNDIVGNQSTTTLKMSIRDFDLASYQARKAYIQEVIKLIRVKYPKAKIECHITDTYSNIANYLGEDRRCIDLIYQSFELLGIKPNTIAMRGGTDGSALSARGLTTPNYFTGAHNFHSCFEFLPLSSFLKSFEVTMKIIELSAKGQ
ncbi:MULTISPECIES: peptidase T [unclassified Gilliamella]|uniref:peptidase T n=1 Tax=unclassified Gilliamella TaxID=2685620 RepID=UPI0022699796|nr:MULTISPECIES: peptidase T [unclassified Gilliamella]MCX8602586.1 peptidase T [Gilliamella sp. B3722]MCX8607906.1 peptidase T [Gilliamella sp. B3771]MCX8611787.1 peptidase T [Gilliamella sp. B3891]MCX8614264.1 peptidase T [Gilliamella sp. B3773]MCX8616027.1 peptidase T [Gilliamella sp. B3770]